MPTDLGEPFTETQMFVAVSSGRKFFLELMISMRNTCRGPTLVKCTNPYSDAQQNFYFFGRIVIINVHAIY